MSTFINTFISYLKYLYSNILNHFFKNTASLRITVDGGTNRWLDFVEKNNIQNPPLPHYITGDFDSITARTKAYFEEKKANFVNTPDQDYTDFTKALQHVNSVALEQKLKVILNNSKFSL